MYYNILNKEIYLNIKIYKYSIEQTISDKHIKIIMLRSLSKSFLSA